MCKSGCVRAAVEEWWWCNRVCVRVVAGEWLCKSVCKSGLCNSDRVRAIVGGWLCESGCGKVVV